MAGVAAVFEGIVVWLSVVLVIFYVYNRVRWQRCGLEELYVQVVDGALYGAFLWGGLNLVYFNLEDGSNAPTVLNVPIGRYLGWMVTCPAILFQVVHLAGLQGGQVGVDTMFGMVCGLQFMVVFGVLSATQADPVTKWVFFTLGGFAGTFLFYLLYCVFQKCYKVYPEKVHPYITAMAVTFFSSWLLFPLLFVLGPVGVNLTSLDFDMAAHAVADLLSKNTFGFVGWYTRWIVLEPMFQSGELEIEEHHSGPKLEQKMSTMKRLASFAQGAKELVSPRSPTNGISRQQTIGRQYGSTEVFPHGGGNNVRRLESENSFSSQDQVQTYDEEEAHYRKQRPPPLRSPTSPNGQRMQRRRSDNNSRQQQRPRMGSRAGSSSVSASTPGSMIGGVTSDGRTISIQGLTINLAINEQDIEDAEDNQFADAYAIKDRHRRGHDDDEATVTDEHSYCE